MEWMPLNQPSTCTVTLEGATWKIQQVVAVVDTPTTPTAMCAILASTLCGNCSKACHTAIAVSIFCFRLSV